MNTKEMTREQISALADGDLLDGQVDVALAALRHDDAKADWDLYHQIGDVLRSDDMAVELSPGFAARMSARLDAEPTVIAPAVTADLKGARSEKYSGNGASQVRRWALPSMAAAAAMATVAFFATPQLMVAMKEADSVNAATSSVASVADQSGMMGASPPEGVVLRDPRIDDYLMAHQRISPSVYSTAQFARSATFATDSNK